MQALPKFTKEVSNLEKKIAALPEETPQNRVIYMRGCLAKLRAYYLGFLFNVQT